MLNTSQNHKHKTKIPKKETPKGRKWREKNYQYQSHLFSFSANNLNQFVCFVVLDGQFLLLSCQLGFEVFDLRGRSFQLLETVFKTHNVGLQFFVFMVQEILHDKVTYSDDNTVCLSIISFSK